MAVIIICMTTTYAIVTFGRPAARTLRWTSNINRAIRAAEAAKGTGTCTAARVIECATPALAKTADIGDTRPGEAVVHCA